MLDGLLGRGGFSSKCKSLIKLTRTRIDVVRRKRGATQKFLKKDIADLLANGLKQNALGRAEGLFAELILSSCYDFIDHVCEIILKHLSAMQKQRECPEDCMEAVASLMFAAARFSDLPELRDLRDLFQERYGNSLEDKVNQQLVEFISPKPPAKEQKLQLLRDVAAEFSISFDGEVHDEPPPKTQPPPPPHDTYHRVHDHEVNKKISNGQDLRSRIPKVPETDHKREIAERGRRGASSIGHVNVDPVKVEPVLRERRGDRTDIVAPRTVQERAKESSSSTLSNKQRTHMSPSKFAEPSPSPSYDSYNKDNIVIPPRKLPGDDSDGSKLKLKNSMSLPPPPGEDTVGSKLKLKNSLSLPPPYVKPGRTTKHQPAELFPSSNEENNNDTLSHESFIRAQQSKVLENNNNHSGFTEVYYKDDSNNNSSAKRRSRRRRTKSSASFSSPDNNREEEDQVEEVRVVRRVATSRRRHESSKKGLQILFDDHHHHKSKPRDEEEKILDKMLLHYSKKDGGGDVEPDRPPPRRTSKRGDEESRRHHNSSRGRDRRKTNEVVVVDDDEEEASQHSSRSFSLPRERMSSETKTAAAKVFTRAASFDHEGSTPAKHVHPKLPNYDDLAARFAALRRNRD